LPRAWIVSPPPDSTAVRPRPPRSTIPDRPSPTTLIRSARPHPSVMSPLGSPGRSPNAKPNGTQPNGKHRPRPCGWPLTTTTERDDPISGIRSRLPVSGRHWVRDIARRRRRSGRAEASRFGVPCGVGSDERDSLLA
jgi:hypothetical protein